MTKYSKSETATTTVRSLVTDSIFSTTDCRLYMRTGWHVEDEVWDDGRIPLVDTNGKHPYSIVEFQGAPMPGLQVYMFDPHGADNGEGVYEPVEYVTPAEPTQEHGSDG